MASYPSAEQHRLAWEDLARRIAASSDSIGETTGAACAPNSRPGQLTIIGSGIEMMGFSIADQALIEAADKVFYCIADPATIVWVKRLRPDALDLYVLYGDDKIRYTTYMQMTEAQLYWVRQGLNVVVIFYGHPGIFVLSTHRAILIARREGHRATMKAAVSALDTLCADLGVDPSHPGLQTHEATDCLTRRRRIDTSLHVVLWQVGLIGELGYRRQGYLNANFSYFINWLQEIYGPDFAVTHYIGSRYPTVPPLVETWPLSKLHEPPLQAGITGLSTFYLPPRDVVPTDLRTVTELGLLQPGQQLRPPSSPIREIGLYRAREREAFRAFARFSIPPSYRWQEDTAASDFLIALHRDPALQAAYLADPLAALNDPRFAALDERERELLASRDAGAIQIAAKGGNRRSPANEDLIARILTGRALGAGLAARVRGLQGQAARQALDTWLDEHGLVPERERFSASLDFVYRNALYPWTGVYLDAAAQRSIALVSNRADWRRSVLHVDGFPVRSFRLEQGAIGWQAGPEVPFSGVIKLDADRRGQRRLVGKTWLAGEAAGQAHTFVAREADPGRSGLLPWLGAFRTSGDTGWLQGEYALRSNGRFRREVMPLSIAGERVAIAGHPVEMARIEGDRLCWRGGAKDWWAGQVTFLPDPLSGAVELFGSCWSELEPAPIKCHGARRQPGQPAGSGLPLPPWALRQVGNVAASYLERGGLQLWHRWEKASFTNSILNTLVAPLL